MTKCEVTLKVSAMLFCLLSLTSCDRSSKQRDEVLAEAQKLRTELEKTRIALEEIQVENDKLRTNLAITSEELEDAQAERDELNREVWEIREPDTEFVSTPQDVVDKMLELAKVTKDDLVYDRAVVTAG